MEKDLIVGKEYYYRFLNGDGAKVILTYLVTRTKADGSKVQREAFALVKECYGSKNHKTSKDISINLESLFPLAEEVFPLGSQVASLLRSNGSVFVVTGHERETNRVICVPIKQPLCDRTRWAYAVNEIAVCEAVGFTFIIGYDYIVELNGEVRIMRTFKSDTCNNILFLGDLVHSNQAVALSLRHNNGYVTREALTDAGISCVSFSGNR